MNSLVRFRIFEALAYAVAGPLVLGLLHFIDTGTVGLTDFNAGVIVGAVWMKLAEALRAAHLGV